MNNHPYLRAYIAGIALPTPVLLVVLTLFSVARFGYQVPVPLERIIIFPMAVVPNVFGLWNVLHLISRSRLPLGIHGAILPFLLAPAGFLLARCLGFLQATSGGLVYFGVVNVGYAYVALGFCAVVIVYYVAWKHGIGFLNQLLGIGGD